MPELKPVKMPHHGGGEIEIYIGDDESACPVCGLLIGEPAWSIGWGVDENGNKTTGEWAIASFDICPCCKIEYGYNDYVEHGGAVAQVAKWAELREQWLKTVTITREIIAQLANINVHLPNR